MGGDTKQIVGATSKRIIVNALALKAGTLKHTERYNPSIREEIIPFCMF